MKENGKSITTSPANMFLSSELVAAVGDDNKHRENVGNVIAVAALLFSQCCNLMQKSRGKKIAHNLPMTIYVGNAFISCADILLSN